MTTLRITKDEGGREWIHPAPPQYFLHQIKVSWSPTDTSMLGKWEIIDAHMDLAVTALFKSRRGAINAFARAVAKGSIT